MRTYDSEFDDGQDTRRVPPRQAEEHIGVTMRAVVAARADAVGTAGLLKLQRLAGDDGVRSLVAQRDEDEASLVRDAVGSPGRPLDQETRTDMERRFGHDFGDVRIHTDAVASESATSVNAHAYTAGTDIVFQSGAYNPGTDAGRHTIAHELTHVIQQKAGPVDGTPAAGGVSLSDPSDRFEREAEATAAGVLAAPFPEAVGMSGPMGGPPLQRRQVAPPGLEDE